MKAVSLIGGDQGGERKGVTWMNALVLLVFSHNNEGSKICLTTRRYNCLRLEGLFKESIFQHFCGINCVA